MYTSLHSDLEFFQAQQPTASACLCLPLVGDRVKNGLYQVAQWPRPIFFDFMYVFRYYRRRSLRVVGAWLIYMHTTWQWVGIHFFSISSKGLVRMKKNYQVLFLRVGSTRGLINKRFRETDPEIFHNTHTYCVLLSFYLFYDLLSTLQRTVFFFRQIFSRF